MGQVVEGWCLPMKKGFLFPKETQVSSDWLANMLLSAHCVLKMKD